MLSCSFSASSSSSSSTEWATVTPFCANCASWVRIIFSLPYRGCPCGSACRVFLPIIMVFPSVRLSVFLCSAGILVRKSPPLPIAQFSSTVTIMFISSPCLSVICKLCAFPDCIFSASIIHKKCFLFKLGNFLTHILLYLYNFIIIGCKFKSNLERDGMLR